MSSKRAKRRRRERVRERRAERKVVERVDAVFSTHVGQIGPPVVLLGEEPDEALADELDEDLFEQAG